MKNQNLDRIVALIKQWFSEQYQENLDGLILYGSQARGDAQEYSDIDVLVVLKQAFNGVAELRDDGSRHRNILKLEVVN
jgi:predicted nucleotidyltransferase